MIWKSWLLFLFPVLVFAAPKKDLHLSYIVSTNDVSFYLNQPIALKISVCEKKEQLCTEMIKTNAFTLTKTERALHLILEASLKAKSFQALLTKRKIFLEDARIKFEVLYARSDIFSKFIEKTYRYLDLISSLPADLVLKDVVNSDTGIVEVSHLLVN